MTQRQANWQGMNWIRKEKRLAIYIRDGMCCAYCGKGVEDGAQLALDHVIPVSQGGDNHATNLITCCTDCNSSRGDRDVIEFIHAVAAYRNVGYDALAAHVASTRLRPLKVGVAKNLIASRGCWADAVAAAADK